MSNPRGLLYFQGMSELLMTYRKLVMPEDENPARRLFGGRLMQWADEAAALYAMCQMRTKSLVTLKISEVLFKNPAQSGDILEFWTRTRAVGRTSFTVECVVAKKQIGLPLGKPQAPELESQGTNQMPDQATVVLSCEFTFVAIGENGRPVRHALSADAEGA